MTGKVAERPVTHYSGLLGPVRAHGGHEIAPSLSVGSDRQGDIAFGAGLRWRHLRSAMTTRIESAPPREMRRSFRLLRITLVALLGLTLASGLYTVGRAVTTPHRTTPIYDPPVLAGQFVPGYCSAGFYARHGSEIVLTTSEHCADVGTVIHDPTTGTFLGVIGPTDQEATCPYPGHTCAASDMNYIIVAPARIPWGHLNVVDMGTDGYRVLSAATVPLGCSDISVGDPIEIDGRGIYRSGTVAEKGDNLYPANEDGSYLPCMLASSVQVGGGDSGGSVLDRGIPAGVTSRSFGGNLGFTPLAGGLTELGLTLCTDPDCGLTPP